MDYLTEQQIDKLSSDTARRCARSPSAPDHIADNLGAYWRARHGHFSASNGVEVELPKRLAALIAQSARVRMEAEKTVSAYRGRGKRVG
jgi:hypothetical protein